MYCMQNALRIAWLLAGVWVLKEYRKGTDKGKCALC
jgi:hypothetical protein